MVTLYRHALLSNVDERQRDKVLEALEPPNRVNPLTGLPFGWDEDTELDGFDQLLTGRPAAE
jgi:hypothetical protein